MPTAVWRPKEKRLQDNIVRLKNEITANVAPPVFPPGFPQPRQFRPPLRLKETPVQEYRRWAPGETREMRVGEVGQEGWLPSPTPYQKVVGGLTQASESPAALLALFPLALMSGKVPTLPTVTEMGLVGGGGKLVSKEVKTLYNTALSSLKKTGLSNDILDSILKYVYKIYEKPVIGEKALINQIIKPRLKSGAISEKEIFNRLMRDMAEERGLDAEGLFSSISGLTKQEQNILVKQIGNLSKTIYDKLNKVVNEYKPVKLKAKPPVTPEVTKFPEGTKFEEGGIKIQRPLSEIQIEEAFLDATTRPKFDTAKNIVLSRLRVLKGTVEKSELPYIEKQEDSLIKLTYDTWKKEGWKQPAIPKAEVGIPKTGIPPIKPPAIPQSGDALFNEAMDDLINKILPAQKVARIETKGLYAATRKPAVAQVEEILAKPKGEETINEAMKALKLGRLPRAQFDVEQIQKLMTQPKKDAIINNLAQNPNLPKALERTNAMIAMKRILSPLKYLEDHLDLAEQVPVDTPLRNFELKLFEKAWGKDNADKIARAILDSRPNPIGISNDMKRLIASLPDDILGKQLSMVPIGKRAKVIGSLQKIGLNVVDALGIPKALKFAYDFSMMFRQLGVSGVRHPISWVKTWKPYFNAMRSERLAVELDDVMRTDAGITEAIQKLGLDLYDIRAGATYWMRPETMASKLAEKFIPGVRMSNRGAGVAVNYFLTDVGKHTLAVMKKMKVSEEEYKAMGSLLNELVGRGEMPRFLRGNVGDILNKLLSSPRYLASRFEWPTKLLSSSKAVRQEAASTLVAWAGVNAAIVAMAAKAGKVELDPRSADFAKIHVGNKRIDIWLGYSQIIRLLVQLAPYVNERGEVDWTMGSRKTASGKIIAVPRSELIGRFWQSKESPGVGAFISLLSGRTYVGEKLDLKTLKGWGKFGVETFGPASLQEMADAYALEGFLSSVLSAIGLAGIGVSTYGEQTQEVPRFSGINR